MRVVLFVRLADGIRLDDALQSKIRTQIRANATPRHVPAVVIAVDDIPRTKSGKITELAVRDVVQDPTTGGSTVAGTYGYMAPEQFKGDATPRSDLYAVGAIAVELLSRQSLIDLVGVDHQLDWKKALAHASEPTKALIGRLLSASPEMRPASAKRVRAEIARIRAGDAPRANRSGHRLCSPQ